MGIEFTVDSHFIGKEPAVRLIYDALLSRLRAFAAVREAPKKTSIDLDNASGFAGVYTRKTYLNLNFWLNYEIGAARVLKVEQLSPRQFMHTVKLERPGDVDDQLVTWLEEAYALAGGEGG